MRRRTVSTLTALATSAGLTLATVALGTGQAAAGNDSPPPPPQNLHVTDVQPESITVDWDRVEGATEYHLVLVPLESAGDFRRTEVDGPKATFGSLTPDVLYKITVRAFVPSAYPTWYTERAEVTARTGLPDGYEPPSRPSNLRVERDAQGEIELFRWDAADGYGTLTYRVHLESPDRPGIDGIWGRTGGLSFDADNLPISGGIFEEGQTVTVWVTARDGIREVSPPSDPLILTCCSF